MGSLSTQLVVAFALTSLTGALLFMQGLSVKLLERRSPRCPLCGGTRRTCTCHRD